MSNLVNYLENQLIDHLFRTNSYSPPASLHFGLITAVADGEAGTITEVSGTGYARVSKTRNGTNFDYTGRLISNLTAITLPVPGAAWDTATHWGVWDAASGGNLLMVNTLAAAKTIGAGDPAPEFAAGELTFDFAAIASDYLASKLANWLFLGAAFVKPAGLYFAYFTTAPTGAGGGVEVSGGGYARVNLPPLDANYTAPAAGDGHTENSQVIQYAAPTANWDAVAAVGVLDAAAGGNLLTFTAIAAVNINNGDAAPKIPVGGFDYTLG